MTERCYCGALADAPHVHLGLTWLSLPDVFVILFQHKRWIRRNSAAIKGQPPRGE